MTSSQTKPRGPLAGYRVLDLCSVLMGPYCTQVLADLGAEVIKLESPQGDTSRLLKPAREGSDPASFRVLNRGKRGIVVDLSDPKGREVCLELARTCDVFIHSIRPQAIAKLGLGYDAVSQSNPGIVYCNMLGFGRNGRYSGAAAYDDIIQALSGAAWLQSQTAGKPQYVSNVIADKVSGLTGVYSIMAALLHRERTGEGQEIDVPMFETLAAFVLVEHITGSFYDPPTTAPVYGRVVSPSRRPYATADGHLAVLVYTDKQWQRFAQIAGRGDLLDDPRVNTITARSERPEICNDMIAEILSTRRTEEWLPALVDAGIPVARVNSTADLFEDPHLADVGFFVSQDDPLDGRVRMPSFPVSFSRTPVHTPPAGPRLGEHTVQVLREAGYTPEEVDALLRERVVVQHASKT